MDEKIKKRILDLRKKGYSIDQISSEIDGIYRWEIQDFLIENDHREEIPEEEIDDEDEIYEKRRRYISWKYYFDNIDLQKKCCDLRHQGISYEKIMGIDPSLRRDEISQLVFFRWIRLEEKRKLLQKIREISKRIGIPESEYSKYYLSYIEFRDLNLQRLRFSRKDRVYDPVKAQLCYGLQRLGISQRIIDKISRFLIGYRISPGRIPSRKVGKYVIFETCHRLARRELFENLENIIKDFDREDDKNNREGSGPS